MRMSFRSACLLALCFVGGEYTVTHKYSTPIPKQKAGTHQCPIPLHAVTAARHLQQEVGGQQHAWFANLSPSPLHCTRFHHHLRKPSSMYNGLQVWAKTYGVACAYSQVVGGTNFLVVFESGEQVKVYLPLASVSACCSEPLPPPPPPPPHPAPPNSTLLSPCMHTQT
jgi:hypothetical protein